MITSKDITTTYFDHILHSTEVHGNHNHRDYVRHNIDIFNVIKIHGKDYNAVYQSGLSYFNNDVSLPSAEIELSEAGGTDPFLESLNGLYACDIDEMESMPAEQQAEIISEWQEVCPNIESIACIRAAYDELMDNNGMAQSYAYELNLCDDPEAYDIDEQTGLACIKDDM
ncbi:hypothetical protein [Shewanella aestuarii]|uniref:Uncharacterized protein n=1 Tax=Shewanella aestuarii TaxID=1028752 RepID=A0A6G9QRJ1_9GAMM|nr:hypothetical protein [Shewanella aestuarii]QIR16665.1 hypothetical protein HBH39_19520 [Shewanella aestuarii]